MIRNPILRGFNPDPNILRDGEDYYIATSTFEWFPGCQVHHSKDLKNWRLLCRPLDRVSQLDLEGVPDSCGVWAPCLSRHRGIFYLVYSNVRSFDGPFVDSPNYVVTAERIEGPWSEPVHLNSSGFDPSLFHDVDGRSWLLNMVVDHRGDRFFGGIILQEFDCERRRLTGPVRPIFAGTDLGLTEGPHLYRRNGWYYLMTAEGGTGYNHAMTLARSRSITGPYEVHPDNPLLSARDAPDNPLQKTGHGDFVTTPEGETFAVFLTSRPLTERGRCTLGRETAIERVEWNEDGWPRLAAGGRLARMEVEGPASGKPPVAEPTHRPGFRPGALDIQFQTLRIPGEGWMSLEERPGFLRLYGQESLQSHFRQSLVARRVQAHHVEASTEVEFEPDSFQQMAGLVCYYNSCHFHYLHVRGDDIGAAGERTFLDILSCDRYRVVVSVEPLEITGARRVGLKVDFDRADLQFHFRLDGGEWAPFGPVLDGSILSDDYVENAPHRFRACFTGAFVGMACQDLSGQGVHADFAWFEYREP